MTACDSEGEDEWDTVRLDRFRQTEQWPGQELAARGESAGCPEAADNQGGTPQVRRAELDPHLLDNAPDYYRQELIQRLAGGDERFLGY